MIRRVAFGIALALIVVFAMLFVALNRQLFEVDVAFLKFEVSSGLALIIAFSGGLLAGALARSRWVAELLAERGRLRRALRLAEARLGAHSPEVGAAVPIPAAESQRAAATGAGDAR